MKIEIPKYIVSGNIKRIRYEKRLHQSYCANFLQMERSNFHRLENRDTELSIIQLCQIAEALDCSIYDLLEGIEPTKKVETKPELKVPEGTFIAFTGVYVRYDEEGNSYLTTQNQK